MQGKDRGVSTETPLDIAKEKLRKLLALARRGIGGEKSNAEHMMNVLMKKYSLTLEDFAPDQQEQISRHSFTYTDRWSKDVLWQSIFKVLKANKVSYGRYKTKGRQSRTVLIDCTKAQAFEISLMHEIYLRALRKDLKNFLIAFFNKHRLASSTEPAADSKNTLSPEDEMAILKMMQSITPVNYRKALNGGKIHVP